MLVLTRKTGEGITLTLTEDLPKGTEFHLQAVRISDHRLRLGIEAPRSVNITRDELLAMIQPQPEAAPIAVTA